VGCRALWWSGYGIALAIFCYTQYYAFFTAFAQGLFVVGDLASDVRKRCYSKVRATASGYLLAMTIAFLLYLPWIPSLLSQLHDVYDNFWIPPVTYHEAQGIVLSWVTGLNCRDGVATELCLPVLGLALIGLFWYPERAIAFCLVQACVPWGLSMVVSQLSGRPIFLERYLLFAHLAFLAYWGVFTVALGSGVYRVLLCWMLIGCGVYGLVVDLGNDREVPDTIIEGALFIKNNLKDGDVVVTDDPANVNRLRYYLLRYGVIDPEVKCVVDAFILKGHVVHLAALSSGDILWKNNDRVNRLPGRIWTASGNGLCIDPRWGCKRLVVRTFGGSRGFGYTVALYYHQE
jgi:hypothetical protein